MQNTIETLSDAEGSAFIAFFDRPANTVAQVQRLKRDKLICLLMLDAGLRVGEVVRLKVCSLWFQGEPVHSIELPYGIAEKGCTGNVPLTERIQYAIRNWAQGFNGQLSDPSSSLAFTTGDFSEPLSTRQVQRMVSKVALATIGRDIHPHVLRHTFGTRLMRSCSMRVVQQLMRHSSIYSTQIYQHPNTNDLTNAISTLK